MNLAETEIVAESDLSVRKTGDPGTILDDNLLTYTIIVTNLGPSLARNVTVTDTLPAGARGRDSLAILAPARPAEED